MGFAQYFVAPLLQAYSLKFEKRLVMHKSIRKGLANYF